VLSWCPFCRKGPYVKKWTEEERQWTNHPNQTASPTKQTRPKKGGVEERRETPFPAFWKLQQEKKPRKPIRGGGPSHEVDTKVVEPTRQLEYKGRSGRQRGLGRRKKTRVRENVPERKTKTVHRRGLERKRKGYRVKSAEGG